MNCNEVQELLSPYADSMLEADEMNLITEHLSTCSDCFCDYQSLQALIGALKSMEEEDLPEGFNERLMACLSPTPSLSSPAREKSIVPSWGSLIPSWAPLGAVAAVLIVLFIGLSPGQIWNFQPSIEGHKAPQQEFESAEKAPEDKSSEGNSNRIALQDSPVVSEEGSGQQAQITIQDRVPDEADPSGGYSGGYYEGHSGIYNEQDSAGSVPQESSATVNRSSKVTNGFRADNGGRIDGSARYGGGLFSAGVPVPFDGPAEEPVSITSSPMVDASDKGIMRISVDSLENGVERLKSLAKSLGGEVKAVPQSVDLAGKTSKTGTATYTVSIPSNAVPAFINGVTKFGDVAENNLSLIPTIPAGHGETVTELQERKTYLSNLLMYTSDADRIRELRQQIASVDMEIVNQKASLAQKPGYGEINIIVEEKGN